MDIKDVIKTRRSQLGLSLEEIGKRIGVGKSTVAKWERGEIANIRRDNIQKLADVLQVSPLVLMEREEPPTIPAGFEPLPPMSNIPIVGRIACGEPILAEENIEGQAAVPAEWNAQFVLICKGESMVPTIHDGDVVAIHRQPMVENGQIAAVRIDDEATLKHIYLYDDHIILQPENPAFAPIVLAGEEMNRATIEGLAVGLCRSLRHHR